MNQVIKVGLQSAILRLMRPVVRLLLKHNIPFGTFSDLIKHSYVQVAKETLSLPGKKLSDSRISVVTGIPRKDIKRYAEAPDRNDKEIFREHNRAARVLTGWIQDKDFNDKEGRPLDLPMEADGNDPSFSILVQKYSGGIPPRAILDECLRIEAIRKMDDQRLRLVSFGYLPSHDELEQIQVLSREVADFLDCIDHNLRADLEDSYLQLSVRCDNLPEECLDKLRIEGGDRGRKLLQDMAGSITRFDRDQNDTVFGTGKHRVVMGVYYYQQEVKDEDHLS